MSQLTTHERILAIVESIPPGHVTTYGSIAGHLDATTARSVGHTLKTDGHHLPWWRVVNASGRPAPGAEQTALEHYQAENTPLMMHDDGTYSVDLAASIWPVSNP